MSDWANLTTGGESAAPPITLDRLRAMMDSIRPMVPQRREMTWASHPNNQKHLDEAIDRASSPFIGAPHVSAVLSGMEILWDRNLPERKTREEWVPPVERFIEYEPKDAEWARPLGIGTVRVVDEGPLFIGIDSPWTMTLPLGEPPSSASEACAHRASLGFKE